MDLNCERAGKQLNNERPLFQRTSKRLGHEKVADDCFKTISRFACQYYSRWQSQVNGTRQISFPKAIITTADTTVIVTGLPGAHLGVLQSTMLTAKRHSWLSKQGPEKEMAVVQMHKMLLCHWQHSMGQAREKFPVGN